MNTPEYKNSISGVVKPLTEAELFAAFYPEVHDRLKKALAPADVLGCVVFESLDLSVIAHRGNGRSAVIFGPNCTSPSLEHSCQQHLGSVPSQFKYPVSYYLKGN